MQDQDTDLGFDVHSAVMLGRGKLSAIGCQ